MSIIDYSRRLTKRERKMLWKKEGKFHIFTSPYSSDDVIVLEEEKKKEEDFLYA